MTTRELAKLEGILRRRVCGVCEDWAAGEDACGRENADTCSLNALLPDVARAILVTDSEEVGPYIQAIREHVCHLCGQLQINGNCDPAERPRCAVDKHMNQVVDAIEEATGRVFDRRPLAQAVPFAG